ncbi:hypothetical protein HDU76_001969 [Blyttiomyces sp. JEL0837]|nr:hypothetical protein HDU76_001969 [Blyttiomyces sp. JEL0837]
MVDQEAFDSSLPLLPLRTISTPLQTQLHEYIQTAISSSSRSLPVVSINSIIPINDASIPKDLTTLHSLKSTLQKTISSLQEDLSEKLSQLTQNEKVSLTEQITTLQSDISTKTHLLSTYKSKSESWYQMLQSRHELNLTVLPREFRDPDAIRVATWGGDGSEFVSDTNNQDKKDRDEMMDLDLGFGGFGGGFSSGEGKEDGKDVKLKWEFGNVKTLLDALAGGDIKVSVEEDKIGDDDVIVVGGGGDSGGGDISQNTIGQGVVGTNNLDAILASGSIAITTTATTTTASNLMEDVVKSNGTNADATVSTQGHSTTTTTTKDQIQEGGVDATKNDEKDGDDDDEDMEAVEREPEPEPVVEEDEHQGLGAGLDFEFF